MKLFFTNLFKRFTIGFFILCFLTILFVFFTGGFGLGKPSDIFYTNDESMMGDDLKSISSRWNRLPANYKDDIGYLNYKIARFYRDGVYLVGVFQSTTLQQYIMIDEQRDLGSGSVDSSISLRVVLQKIAEGYPPIPDCNIGSGKSLYMVLTCDGYIVVWDDSYCTHIYDAVTLERIPIYFYYRLIHGMLV